MDTNTERIESYLLDRMSIIEKQEFEAELMANPELMKELEIQKMLMKVAQNEGMKQLISKRMKQIRLKRNFYKIAGTIVLLAIISFLAIKSFKSAGETSDKTKSAFDVFRNDSANSNALVFAINSENDTIIETKGGIVFAIPSECFDTKEKEVKLLIEEALTPLEIMKAGYSTLSDGKPLETAGMFSIYAYDKNSKIDIKKNIHVRIPTDSFDSEMMFFKGVKDSSGIINWVDPKPMTKAVSTLDIGSLDFYPPKYLETLKLLGYDHTNKKFTDSVYFSFSGYRAQRNTDWINKKATREIIRKSAPDLDYSINVDTSVYFDTSTYEIDPSRIRAIWNTKFNHTIISTKAFEERLKFIFTTCESKYIDFYVNNIEKNLFEIDQICADHSSGNIKAKFLEFASRKEGGVAISDRTKSKLNRYFQRKYELYQKAGKKSWDKLNRNEFEKDIKLRSLREKSFQNEIGRRTEIFNQELCLNLVESYRQLGHKIECPSNMVIPSRNYYSVSVVNTGVYNLDKYVLESTITRTSLKYVSPSGKSAEINYNPVGISIKNHKDYSRCLVYMIPKGFKSFIRLQHMNNNYRFNEKLNGFIDYDLVAIGFRNDSMFYRKIRSVKSGNLELELNFATEARIQDEFKDYDINIKDIQVELTYQKEEIKGRKRQIEKNKRNSILRSIFPCFSPYETDELINRDKMLF